MLDCEGLKQFKDGTRRRVSRGRGIFQQKNICDMVHTSSKRRDARVF